MSGEVERRHGVVQILVSIAEINILLGCANEAKEAIADWEFHARLGVELDELRALEVNLRERASSALRAFRDAEEEAH